MALQSYRTYVNGFPISSASPLIVHDASGESGFKCGLDDFTKILNDEQILYRTLFPAHVALVEDLARELIQRLIEDKGVDRSAFAGLAVAGDLAEAIEHYISVSPVEVWGNAILKLGSRKWSDLKGGKRVVVEAITIRNLLAHGIPVFNQKAINRIAAATTAATSVTIGDPIILDKTSFARHVGKLRSFARLLADSVTNLPDPANAD